jgi:hypothetical protein
MVVKSGGGSLLVKGAALALEVELGEVVGLAAEEGSANDDVVDTRVREGVNMADDFVKFTECEGDTDDVADVN